MNAIRPADRWRWIRTSAIMIGALVALVGLYISVVDLSGNVHEVVTDQVYRSGQLSPSRLSDVIAKHGIRSVLNLRGPNPGKPWYDEEVATCATLGISHFDVSWSALHDIDPERCDSLDRLMERAPKPLLLHCQAGADRSGLAASIYLLGRGFPPETARQQLSIWYLHFPYLGSGTRAMDDSFDRYSADVRDRTVGRSEESQVVR